MLLSQRVSMRCRCRAAYTRHRRYSEHAAPPLAVLQQAILGWPGGRESRPIDLTLHDATKGGHVLLGNNGHGKTLIASALAREGFDEQCMLRGGLLQRLQGGEDGAGLRASVRARASPELLRIA